MKKSPRFGLGRAHRREHSRLEHALARLREIALEGDAERHDNISPVCITTTKKWGGREAASSRFSSTPVAVLGDNERGR